MTPKPFLGPFCFLHFGGGFVTVLYVYRFCGKPQTRFPDSGPQTEREKGMDLEPILQIQT